MRILHVVRQFHPSIGGIERFTLDLCRFSLRQGHECGVVTLNRDFATGCSLPSSETVEGISVKRVPFFGPKRYRLAPQVLRCLDGYDLIHVHCVDFFADYLGATRLLHKRPLVVSTHGGFFHSPWGSRVKRLFFDVVTRMTMRSVDRVVCDSRQDLALFSRIASSKCTLIENGIDYESFAQVKKRVIPGLLLYIGRTDANKRLDRLIEMMALLAKERPEAALAFVGPDWLGEWPRLQRLAISLGLQERVHFVGKVSDAELRRWLSEAHYFVSASVYEGFGIAAVEAMASGTVPILNDIPAFRNIVRDGESGLLIDFGEPRTASRRIAQALAAPVSAYEDMSGAAKETASRYRWEAVGEQFISLYEGLLRR
jgi:alpha-1,3-mannosyltransferase